MRVLVVVMDEVEKGVMSGRTFSESVVCTGEVLDDLKEAVKSLKKGIKKELKKEAKKDGMGIGASTE